jgi:hypothetical protein
VSYQARNFRKNDDLKASDLRAMDAEIVRLGKLSVSGAQSFSNGPGGPTIVVSAPVVAIFPAVATSSITARSGSTVGTGTFKARTLSGSTLSDGATGLTCKSNFETSVASGKALMIGRDADGVNWLLSADCPD